MRSISAIGILVFMLFTSTSSYALIQNNLILTPDYSICIEARSPRIVGASPVGGTIPYSFQWIVSTTDSMSGFSPGPGISDGINYIPPLFTETTWFRRVVMSAGEVDTSAALTVTVLPYPHPSAGYIVNNAVQCFTGHSYAFTDTSTVSSGSIVTKTWDFGDVTYSIANNPVKVFSGPFNYNVKLVVTTDHGCRDSMIRTMSVLLEPEADFACDSMEQCFEGNSFLLLDASTISMGSLTSQWYFDDGTDSITGSLRKSYLSPGTHTVKMISITDFNCKDSVTKILTVHPNPKAGFTVNDDEQCLSLNAFALTDTSFISSGTITGRTWDIGNGETDSLPETIVSYDSAAVYSITLIPLSDHGCTDTFTRTVSVNSNIAIGFTIDNDSQCFDGNSFVFQDTSSMQNRMWRFANGDTSGAMSPVVSFPLPGVHAVTLILSNPNGCTDSATQHVVVHPAPGPNKIIGDDEVFIATEYSYAVTNKPGSMFNWSCEDGAIVSGNDSSSVQILWGTTLGPAFLKVTETTAFGCSKDIDSIIVSINPIPDSLRCDKDTILLNAAASSDSIFIQSNTSWTIDNPAAWITILTTQGSGDSLVHIVFGANAGFKRTAVIRVIAGSLSKDVVVIQNGSVGLDEFSPSKSVSVYPNPSSGLFTILNSNNELINTSLYDISGKLICGNKSFTTGNHILDYSYLTNGVYALQISSNMGTQTIRVIISR
jgi:PKD repeat protein